MQTPSLHAWVKDDLARLRKVGIEPSFAEVVWLSDLAKAAHTSPGREVIQCHAAPIKFCGAVFYPFHLRARYWYAEWRDLFDGDGLLQDGLYFFAHVHSKPGDVSLVELSTADAVQDAVKAWLRQQEFSEADSLTLAEALYRMDHGDDNPVSSPETKPDNETQSIVTLEERVAELCELFPGTTPTYWQSEISSIEGDKLAAAMIAATGDEGAWATSAIRTRKIGSYMNAVKWIMQRALSIKHA
jgi:hypothetical protein